MFVNSQDPFIFVKTMFVMTMFVETMFVKNMFDENMFDENNRTVNIILEWTLKRTCYFNL